ncbi:MAG: IS200/IS605 family transposase [Aggregatilineales bacterium]
MSHWKCFYHIVWATKHRQPTITVLWETLIFETVKTKCTEQKCTLLAINGTEDHIHLAVNIPPQIAVAKFIATIKGASSHEVNKSIALEEKFRWQTGYSVHTFGERALKTVIDYIERQKEHHAEGTLYDGLEPDED